MRTLRRAAIALPVAAILLLLNVIPAAAAATIAGGRTVAIANHRCTLSFVDPVRPNIAYTAGHCYSGGAEVISGRQRLGLFRPDIYNKDLDLVAIHLYDGVRTQGSVCGAGRCRPILDTRVAAVGDYVCKIGATSAKSCGRVIVSTPAMFRAALHVEAGDSGGPVFTENKNGGVLLLGVVQGSSKSRPGDAYITQIAAINGYLSRIWGSGWSWPTW